MGLRLVDDGNSSGDDRAALAEARQSVAEARGRLQVVADRLAELRQRLGEGTATEPGSEARTSETTGHHSPTSSD